MTIESGNIVLRWPEGSATVTLDKIVGRGGEGVIWSIIATAASAPLGTIVVKIYHDDLLVGAQGVTRLSKVIAMVRSQPASKALCWPSAAASRDGRVIGFAMPLVNVAKSSTWALLTNPADRTHRAPTYSFRYALRSVRNLAAAINSAHQIGAVLGDLNESNLLVGDDASVTIIDTDSAQVNVDGTTMRCAVGKPEFTAPELVGERFTDVDRTSQSDIFAFAVLGFQMLVGGAHPYDGIPTDLDTDLPSVQERIKRGLCPYFGAGQGVMRPAPRVAFAGVPKALIPLFEASLLGKPNARPSLQQWWQTLSEVDTNLAHCNADSGHAYDRRDGTCPWCAHSATGALDPWQQAAAMNQEGLPPLRFNGSSRAQAAIRAPRTPSAGAVSLVPPGPANGRAPSGPGLNTPAPHTAPVGGPGPPVPHEMFRSWGEAFMCHPVRTVRHFSGKAPLLGAIGPRWIAKGGTVVSQNHGRQAAKRIAVAVASVPLVVAAAFFGGLMLGLSVPENPFITSALASKLLALLMAGGAAAAAAIYTVGAFRQAHWRVTTGWQWGDTWRLPVAMTFGAVAAVAAVTAGFVAVVVGLIAKLLRRLPG